MNIMRRNLRRNRSASTYELSLGGTVSGFASPPPPLPIALATTTTTGTPTTAAVMPKTIDQDKPMLGFDALAAHVKMEPFNFLNADHASDGNAVDDNNYEFDFRMNNNTDDLLLHNFAALLYDDSNSDILADGGGSGGADSSANVINRVEPNTFLNNAEPSSSSVVVKKEPDEMSNESESKEKATIVKRRELQTSSSSSLTSSEIKMCIYAEHDYLSKENTIALMESQDDKVLLQRALNQMEQASLLPVSSSSVAATIITTAVAASTTIHANANVTDTVTAIAATTTATTTTTLANVTVSSNTIDPLSLPSSNSVSVSESQPSDVISLESIVKSTSVDGAPLNEHEFSELVKELTQHTRNYTNKIRGQSSIEKQRSEKVADSVENRSSDMSSQTEPEFEFPHNHSEPLEYDKLDSQQSTQASSDDTCKGRHRHSYFVEHNHKKFALRSAHTTKKCGFLSEIYIIIY